MGLAKRKASTGAVLAYWLGNPMLNPATLAFMGFVLGWGWVALRLATGLLLVFGISHLAGRLAPAEDLRHNAADITAGSGEGDDAGSLPARWGRAFRRLAVGLIPEYLLIVVVLGAVRAWLFPAMTPALGHSLWLLPALAAAGTLFVIPTAGEIPIVQALTAFGLGAGGAGALLTVLPPVSLPSLVMLRHAVPARVLLLVAGIVAVLGVLSGLAALALGF